MDPHQASHQPQLTLTVIPLSFDFTSKFLGTTFDRILSFGSQVRLLRTKFFSRFKALRSLSLFCGAPARSPSPKCIKLSFARFFICLHGVVHLSLRYTEKSLEVYHRIACSAISGCLAYPSLLLFLESIVPLLPTHTGFAFLQILFSCKG